MRHAHGISVNWCTYFDDWRPAEMITQTIYFFPYIPAFKLDLPCHGNNSKFVRGCRTVYKEKLWNNWDRVYNSLEVIYFQSCRKLTQGIMGDQGEICIKVDMWHVEYTSKGTGKWKHTLAGSSRWLHFTITRQEQRLYIHKRGRILPMQHCRLWGLHNGGVRVVQWHHRWSHQDGGTITLTLQNRSFRLRPDNM